MYKYDRKLLKAFLHDILIYIAYILVYHGLTLNKID